MKNRKAIAQKRHAKRRLATRYGLKLSDHLMQYCRHAIKSNKAILVERQSLRVAVYDMLYTITTKDTDDPDMVGKEVMIRFVYDKNRKQIVSALPTNNS
jgi:hypothetical protein